MYRIINFLKTMMAVHITEKIEKKIIKLLNAVNWVPQAFTSQASLEKTKFLNVCRKNFIQILIVT